LRQNSVSANTSTGTTVDFLANTKQGIAINGRILFKEFCHTWSDSHFGHCCAPVLGVGGEANTTDGHLNKVPIILNHRVGVVVMTDENLSLEIGGERRDGLGKLVRAVERAVNGEGAGKSSHCQVPVLAKGDVGNLVIVGLGGGCVGVHLPNSSIIRLAT